MAKKQFFLIVDTETTITDKVADFGAVIVDRNGKIFAQCAVMVGGVFGTDPLFYNQDSGLWGAAGLEKRTSAYHQMIVDGSRMVASVAAVNRWLEKVNGKYSPSLTAYNLAFDASKCRNTGIDLSMFETKFCLWQAAVGNICQTKAYKHFVLHNHLINTRTKHGNMTFSTTAEAVAGFIGGSFQIEPHTALEDVIYFELPILVHILKKKNWKDNMVPYNWKQFQLKDHFKA